jgi:hypothetical protein
MTTLTWFLTILGLVATLIGSYIAIITFRSPLTRLKKYLKIPKNWGKIYINRVDYIWRYRKHPEFSITQDDETKSWTTVEKWMIHYPDPHKSSTLIKATFNGIVLLTEDFISLDGGRYFVPIPKRKAISELGDMPIFEYWYTPLQINLARIVGYYYRVSTIEEFMTAHHLIVKTDEE